MLIQLLVELNSALKAEGIKATPEQLTMASKYVLFGSGLFPDEDLASSLKPILMSRIEEEEAYWKAWKRLKSSSDEKKHKWELYHLLGDHKSAGFPPKLSASKKQGLEWQPWQAYQKYQEKMMSKDQWEHRVMEALAQEEKLDQWEKSIDDELEKRFLEGQNGQGLLEQAREFRKEFFLLRRQWNSVMKAAISPKENMTPKWGEKKSLRPNFYEGTRANIERWGDPRLFTRPIEKITEDEILQLQEPIRRMAERLKVRMEKMRQQGGGYIDMKKTLRCSIKTLGEPVKIYRRLPKRKPARWIVLADVSGSVKHASRLFMSFLFELKNVLAEGIHTFVFVSKVQTVNKILEESNYHKMVYRLYQEGTIDFRGYSDYGVAFAEFDKLTENILDQQSILLIIGDARNNRRDPRLDLLQKWSLCTRKLIWFNPDLPEKWNQGDSIVGIYQQNISQLYDVSTPEKLVNAIENVIL